MDDNKSDNTDELLTSIDPLIFQSETLLSDRDYHKDIWQHDSYTSFRPPIIIDDILSARSNTTYQTQQDYASLFKTPLCLSQTNVAVHNSVDTSRTDASQYYEASASSQTTPRNFSHVKMHSVDSTPVYKVPVTNNDLPINLLKKDVDQLNAMGKNNFNDSRSEIQRMQLTNKQLSTQLQEAKLTIQSLTVQLEQVQLECKHKENTLENLDNTLGRLVAGWKKRDAQKDLEIDNLSHQIDTKDNLLCETQRIAEESKISLATAMSALGTEKMKVEHIERNLNQEIEALKKERNQIINDNKELAKRFLNLESELKKIKEICVQKSNNLESVKQQASGEKQQLEKDINHTRNENEKLKEEGSNLILEIKFRDDKLDQLRNEVKRLEDDLYKNRKEMMEKDSHLSDMKAKLRGMSDEHNTVIRKLEKEFQNRTHLEISSSIASLNEQHKKTLQLHNGNLQAKLNEQSKRHRLELERLRQVAEQEIASRLADSQETISMLRARLERSEKSVQFWQQEKESVEKARNQISSRLYEVMSLNYRGSDQEVSKHPSSVRNQCHQVSVPKAIHPTNYVNSLAQFPLPSNAVASNCFEPIKADYVSSILTTPTSFSKSSSYSLISDAQGNSHPNLALTSSINTALSY